MTYIPECPSEGHLATRVRDFDNTFRHRMKQEPCHTKIFFFILLLNTSFSNKTAPSGTSLDKDSKFKHAHKIGLFLHLAKKLQFSFFIQTHILHMRAAHTSDTYAAPKPVMHLATRMIY